MNDINGISEEALAADQERAKNCGQAIREALQKYDCVINVSQLDISTGRVLPIVQIRAAPKRSNIIQPAMAGTREVPSPVQE